MEKWDLYTKYREKTGRECIRGEELPEGLYHLTVHVWIRNAKGEYLMAQRSADRPVFPLMWECVSGSVLKGESSIEGAVREVKEEVGLDLEPGTGRRLLSKIRGSKVQYEGKAYNDILDVWLFPYDGEFRLEEATTDEVAEGKWMAVSQIRDLYEQKKLVRTLDYFSCVLDAKEPDYRHIIGKTVRGKVDRPLGTIHPHYPDISYPINYGYVEDTFAADGEEQDVYVFGAKEPLLTFEGKVIAVWHRFDDSEDKWIVSLNGEAFREEVILGDISFQEQFFWGKLYQ